MRDARRARRCERPARQTEPRLRRIDPDDQFYTPWRTGLPPPLPTDVDPLMASWVKLQTNFYLDPVVASLSDGAERAFVRSIAYAGSAETGGLLPRDILATFVRQNDRRKVARLCTELLQSGLWLVDGNDYRIRSWDKYQAALEDGLTSKERERIRKADYRARQRMSRDNVPSARARSREVEEERETEKDKPNPNPSSSGDDALINFDDLEPPSRIPNPHDHFEEFWRRYPRKVGKQAARRAWVTATKRVPPWVIINGCERMAADPNLPTDRTKIPHPTTWLNGGRWDDEPYPEPVTPMTTRTAERKSQSARWDQMVRDNQNAMKSLDGFTPRQLEG